jgi:hypothetical protein
MKSVIIGKNPSNNDSCSNSGIVRDFVLSPRPSYRHASLAPRRSAAAMRAAIRCPRSAGVRQTAVINELIALFDGPEQREAQKLTAEARGETGASDA